MYSKSRSVQKFVVQVIITYSIITQIVITRSQFLFPYVVDVIGDGTALELREQKGNDYPIS